MVQVEFDFKQALTVIQADSEDIFNNVLDKYIQKTMMDKNSLYFIANGKLINPEKKIKEELNEINKKSLKILVYEKDTEKKEQLFEKSKEIICPICQEPCLIKIENFKIKLYGCKNGHSKQNIQFTDFLETQKLNLSKIICNTCKKSNKGNTNGNLFFKCLNCQQNLCPLCKTYKHDQEHNIIKYELKNYLCNKHYESFIKYCKTCKLNLCFECEGEHKKNKEFKEHEIISLNNLIIDEDEIKNKIIEIKNLIKSFNENIKMIIQQLNDFLKSIESYYDINNDIINNYKKKNRNYEVLNNTNETIFKNKIFEEIKKINENDNINKKISDIISLYNNIVLCKESHKEIEIYKKLEHYIPFITLKENEIILNQMKNCICGIKNEKNENTMGFITKINNNNELIPIIVTKGNNIYNNNIEIELFESKKNIKLGKRKYINKENDISLLEIENNNDINRFIEINEDIMQTENNINENKYNNKEIYTFGFNNNDIILSFDILKFDKKNKYQINHSVKYSPIILKENNKLIGISLGKSNNNQCLLLNHLIKEFIQTNNNNKIIINNIIQNICSNEEIALSNNKKNMKLNKIKIIYDIKDKKKIKLFGYEFVQENKNNCYIIINGKKEYICEYFTINDKIQNKNLLEIELIEIKKIVNMQHLFGDNNYNGCDSLKSLPDISDWDMTKVTNMSCMFCGCGSLELLSDISEWNTSEVTDMNYMFCNCSSLKSLPDISKWNVSKVTNMELMFWSCESLISLPDISKWDVSNVINMNSMFRYCKSLVSLPDVYKWKLNKNLSKVAMFNGCKKEIIPENFADSCIIY